MSWAQLGWAGLGWHWEAWHWQCLNVNDCCMISKKKSFNLHRSNLLPADPKLWQFIRHAPCHKWKHHIQTWAHKTSECKIIQLRTEDYQHPLANYSRHAYLPRFFYARKSRPSQEHMHTTHTSRVVHAHAHTNNVIEPTNKNPRQ